MENWSVKRSQGSVADRHLTLPTFESRQIIIHEIDKPTMVFGTAQKNMFLETAIECDYVYRKSGGGAVFLEPGKILWVDFVVPREDPLWCNDIRRSSLWLGELWVRAMKDIGLYGKVHNEEIRKTELSRLVCFAGLATGEVTVSGKKLLVSVKDELEKGRGSSALLCFPGLRKELLIYFKWNQQKRLLTIYLNWPLPLKPIQMNYCSHS